jgi:hypothetical protein
MSKYSTFSQHADLRADVSITDDTECLATHFDAAGGGLHPAPAMAQRVFLRNATREHDGFGDDEFGDAARVRVGRIEHRYAERLCSIGVDLVGADAEAADRDQAPRFVEHVGGQVGARANADQVRVGDAALEFGFGQCFFVVFDVRVAGALQRIECSPADAFEQQHLDVLLRIRGFHRSPPAYGNATMPELSGVCGSATLDDCAAGWHAASSFRSRSP